MAGAIRVIPAHGSLVSVGPECSSSRNSSFSIVQASCSRSNLCFDACSLTLSPRGAALLPRNGLSSWNSWSGHGHLGNVQIWKTKLGKQLLSQRAIVGRIQASLLGVGAPEALVIAVVALLVFGPKGLAEVARNLGKSLKAFQPTIRELQEVSREFRSTLEQEIGLDEMRATSKPEDTNYRPSVNNSGGSDRPSANVQNPSAPSEFTSDTTTENNSESKAYSTEDYVRVTAEQAKALVPEELRKESERAAWGGAPPTSEDSNIDGAVRIGENKGVEN